MRRFKSCLLSILFIMLLAAVCPVNVMAKKAIIIGAPLSTAYVYGWGAERGIRLAVEEINARGGVDVKGEKMTLKVEVIDTRDLEPGVPVSEALMAVERLMLNKNADFIIGGPNRSEAALAAMSLLSKYKKVSIVTSGVLTPKYHAMVAQNYDKFKYCFRIHGEAKHIVGEMLANFIDLKEKHGLTKLFIMAQDVSHARGAANIIGKVAGSKGFEITGTEIFPTGTTDFSMGLLKAKSTGSQIINIWMDMPESAILLKQWYDLKIPALPFGSTLAAAEQPGFWKATQGKGEFALCNVINAGNAPSDATPWTMKFYNAYEKRWGVEPEGLGCSSSYMAVYTLKEAIEKAGTLKSDKVVQALEQTDIMGVYGRLRFDPKSHQVIFADNPKEGAVGSILQWQDGKRVVVFPKSIAKGEIKLPPWIK